jgi:hypothetical protein
LLARPEGWLARQGAVMGYLGRRAASCARVAVSPHFLGKLRDGIDIAGTSDSNRCNGLRSLLLQLKARLCFL